MAESPKVSTAMTYSDFLQILSGSLVLKKETNCKFAVVVFENMRRASWF